MQTYCSDALEEAMMLAQTKAINSYSFRDCLNYLNYQWRDIYQRMNIAEDGYYSKTVRLTAKQTKLPECVMDTALVYRATSPTTFNRRVYKQSGFADLYAPETYHISGFDLFCPDAERFTIWLSYVPQPPFLNFTKNSRDPKFYDNVQRVLMLGNIDKNLYNLHRLEFAAGNPATYTLKHRGIGMTDFDIDITDTISRPDWTIEYVSCDFPYMFISYKHSITSEYSSYVFKNMTGQVESSEYNCFAYTGRNSNVEYYKTTWNDYTGMGVIVLDHNDNKFKEMGFTSDSLLVYPIPEMYRLFVAKLAEKFAALNETNLMGVSNELAAAQYAFDTYLRKDKSSWSRIDNVIGTTMGDYL